MEDALLLFVYLYMTVVSVLYLCFDKSLHVVCLLECMCVYFEYYVMNIV